jgi:hypothetical protein
MSMSACGGLQEQRYHFNTIRNKVIFTQLVNEPLIFLSNNLNNTEITRITLMFWGDVTVILYCNKVAVQGIWMNISLLDLLELSGIVFISNNISVFLHLNKKCLYLQVKSI